MLSFSAVKISFHCQMVTSQLHMSKHAATVERNNCSIDVRWFFFLFCKKKQANHAKHFYFHVNTEKLLCFYSR